MTRDDSVDLKATRPVLWRWSFVIAFALLLGLGWWLLRRPIDPRLVSVWSVTRSDSANWTGRFAFRPDGTATVTWTGPDGPSTQEWMWFVQHGQLYLDPPDRPNLLAQMLTRVQWLFQQRQFGPGTSLWTEEIFDVESSGDEILLRFVGSSSKLLEFKLRRVSQDGASQR